jgi:hypothetical protein
VNISGESKTANDDSVLVVSALVTLFLKTNYKSVPLYGPALVKLNLTKKLPAKSY